MYKRILVTLDRSSASEAILPQVESMADLGETEVVLLTVAEVPQSTGEAPHPLVVGGAIAPGAVIEVPPARTFEDKGQALERTRQELGDYLQGKAAALGEKGLHVETDVAFGDPAEEILAAAKAREADLIMMATHGRTGLAQAVFGSVASGVLRSGVAPVLLVRPKGLREGNDS